MMVSLFLSRVLGIARDSIMTAQFGRNSLTDAYTLAFMIPDLLFFLVAGGALSSAFIPVFSEYLHTDRKREAWRVFSGVATIMSAALLILITLAWVFTVPLLGLVVSAEQKENIGLIAGMSRIVLPAQFAFFIGGLMFGTLYAHQRFSIPGLGPNIYNLGIIIGAVVISRYVDPSISGMAWGALIGAIIGNLILPGLEMRKIGVQFRPSFDLSHPGVRKVFILMAPVVLGLSLPGVYGLLMRSFGSGYPGGVVTSLDLANKLMQAPLGVFGQSFAIAIFPALSQFFAQERMDLYRDQVVKTMRTVIYITVPISIFMAVLAPDVVNALFGYGKGRDSDPQAMILSLQLFCLGIPAWCLHPILMRGYFSMQQTVKPIVLGTLTTVVFIGISLGLMGTPMSYLGLPLASSISAMVLAITMTITLSRDSGGFELRKIMEALDQCLLAGVAMTAALIGLCLLWSPGTVNGGNVGSFVRIIGFGLIGAWIYVGITKAMKMPETSTIDRALNKVRPKR